MTFNIIWQSLSAQKQFLSLNFLEVNNGHLLWTIYYVVTQKLMTPQTPEEDVMIKFCKSWEGQKQWFTDILQNRCS